MIAAGNSRRPSSAAPCRHLSLTGTFDAYEGWSTIDFVPRKSMWGTWAWALASLASADQGQDALCGDASDGSCEGLDAREAPPALNATNGVYVSWANRYNGSLLSAGDVHFLAA